MKKFNPENAGTWIMGWLAVSAMAFFGTDITVIGHLTAGLVWSVFTLAMYMAYHTLGTHNAVKNEIATLTKDIDEKHTEVMKELGFIKGKLD